MKFFKKNGGEFVDNARSKLRVTTVKTIPGKPGRITKILFVNEVICSSPENPIKAGNAIALSFPVAKCNASEYEWKPGEDCQVKVEMGEPGRIIKPDKGVQFN
jgi:hypothetical protein